jgi:hypothetical protein
MSWEGEEGLQQRVGGLATNVMVGGDAYCDTAGS